MYMYIIILVFIRFHTFSNSFLFFFIYFPYIFIPFHIFLINFIFLFELFL